MVLTNRLQNSLAPLLRYLQILGVDSCSQHQTGRICRYAIPCWGLLLLILHAQSASYLFFHPSRFKKSWRKMYDIIRLVTRASTTVLNLTAHWFLLTKMGPFILSFANRLKKIDKSLGTPNLSSVYKCSVSGIIWILITVIHNWICWFHVCPSTTFHLPIWMEAFWKFRKIVTPCYHWVLIGLGVFTYLVAMLLIL